MCPRKKYIFDDAIQHCIKRQEIDRNNIIDLLENPDKFQTINSKPDNTVGYSYKFLLKYFPANDYYLIAMLDCDKDDSLVELYTVFPNLMDDIESAQPYDIYKELAQVFGLPFVIGNMEETFVEYAEIYLDSGASDDVIIAGGKLPEDTSFSANFNIKIEEDNGGKRIIYFMSFIMNDTEYLHWLHEEKIKRNQKVRILLPEGHVFPPSAPFEEFKSKLAGLRTEGTISVGMDLFPLLMAQNRLYAVLFCYKFKRYEIALYIEKSVNLVFQHYDDNFDHLREAKISLRNPNLKKRMGEVRVAWSRKKSVVMIIDSNKNIIDRQEAT